MDKTVLKFPQILVSTANDVGEDYPKRLVPIHMEAVAQPQMELCDSTEHFSNYDEESEISTVAAASNGNLHHTGTFTTKLGNNTDPGVGGNTHVCVVCGDESDGLHFGQYTCRACAAFFRRSVSLKLHYTCKQAGHCEIEKNARNMCRSCRFNKCLRVGMLPGAVQHSRDGLGKRSKDRSRGESPDRTPPQMGTVHNNNSNSASSASSTPPDVKIAKPIVATILTNGGGGDVSSGLQSGSRPTAFHGLYATPQGISAISPSHSGGHSSSPFGGVMHADYLSEAGLLGDGNGEPRGVAVNLNAGAYMISNNFANLVGKPVAITTSYIAMHPIKQLATIPTSMSTSPNPAFAMAPTSTQQLQQPTTFILPSSSSNSAQLGTAADAIAPMRYLSRMLEGYHHFLSLRKASYTLVEGLPQFRSKDEIPQSNFGTSKKICKIEASLIMDTVEKFFTPFDTLQTEDKNQLFDSFYCLFSNTERAFRTYKTFSAEDDRLIMPDGGYIRLSELEKFYENNSLVRGDPLQVAKIFENAMQYMINVVVAHMRAIEIAEMELIAIVGMFLWRDGVSLQAGTAALVSHTRNSVLSDLHAYYRSLGYREEEITIKVANLLLLLPKLENSLKLFKENFSIAELFNMVQMDSGCSKINSCS